MCAVFMHACVCVSMRAYVYHAHVWRSDDNLEE